MRYAEVALDVPVHKSFSYHLPAGLRGRVAPGCLVRVQFGVAMQPAVLLALHEDCDIPETKPILELLDPQPALSADMLALARWLSERCLAPIGACVWLMLPPGFAGKSDRRYRFLRDTLAENAPQQAALPGVEPAAAPPLEQRLLQTLSDKGPRRLRQLKAMFPKQRIEGALERLTAAGALAEDSVLAPPAARKKTVTRLYPNYRLTDVEALAQRFHKPTQPAALLAAIAERAEDAIGVQDALDLVGAKSKAPLKRLINDGLVFVEKTARGEQDLIILEAEPARIEAALARWRGSRWSAELLRALAALPAPPTLPEALRLTGASRARIKKLIAAGLLEAREEQVWRDSLRDFDFVPDSPPTLTPDQQAVWQAIRRGMAAGGAPRFLLHGVTGSGKTEIYLQAIEETLAQGRRALLLVPEIALTPQTVRRVYERFPGRVALAHGSLPRGERYDTWQRARAGEIDIIVGTRSALFSPLPALGLIVLDEAHDGSYKQGAFMPPPQYHARDAAEFLAQRVGAALILGSATPDLGDWYRAGRGGLRILRLPQRIMGHRQRIRQQAERLGQAARYRQEYAEALTIPLAPVEVVDMRAELRAGNASMFSRALRQALADALERGEQAILLLNRRGEATYIFCRDCGNVLQCERCDRPLTYHRVERGLRCHHCGARQPYPRACPACGSARIRHFGAGTQQVESALARLFPAARALRWDIDTARSPKMHFEILDRFGKREADVLIGTQMIAKGLDLPLVTLVGVVSADYGLALPDYRAGERVFQLLTQVSGRAGRGLLGGKVILQSYQPQHYVIQAAARQDYAAFAERELAYRKEMGYPPYRRLARIVFSHASQERARQEAETAAARLRKILAEQGLRATSIIGPAPCFYARVDRHYRWQLLLRGPDPRAALRQLRPAPGWRIDIDPLDLL